jgi:oligo-1,6-glucosidase
MRSYIILLLATILSFSCNEKKTVSTISQTLPKTKDWWKEAIIYQLYPRSFKDTDGDGVGDLKGIIQELDYIKSLGVTAVWINPIYSSPNEDNGYDISDYKNIMKDFGTMADFDAMLKGMHDRGISLIMDVVVNHSSDEHEWFKQSRSSRDNKYRNYYHWWPVEKGKPAHRYSLFDVDGNAWKYDSLTKAYYLHYFAAKQPDLNWENPELRNEVSDIMKFWAEKGVDGFRLDAFQFAAKDTTFPVINDDLEKNFIKHYAMQGNIHEYIKEMNTKVFSKYNVMSVAEGAGKNFEDAHNLVDEDRNEFNMAYAFEAVDLPKYDGYKLSDMKEVFTKWDSAFVDKGWLSIFLSNHDQARQVSRWGNDSPEFRIPSAKLLNTFLLSMRGTPYCYYGDEIGMKNIRMEKIEQYDDIQSVNRYKLAQSRGEDMKLFMEKLKFGSRDNGRTPLQWNADLNAGFTSGQPWLPVNPDYTKFNIVSQSVDQSSILIHFKSLTKLRKENKVLIHGKYQIYQKDHPTVYAYTRTLGNEKVMVLLNFSTKASMIEINDFKLGSALLSNNYADLNIAGAKVSLQPYQAVIFRVN